MTEGRETELVRWIRLQLDFWVSRDVLLSRFVLTALFWVNLLGTVYGFMWYGNQLEYTLLHRPVWMTLLVPDSPTASLFFTLSIGYLLVSGKDRKESKAGLAVRAFVDTFGAVTSVKYGIWAVAMIADGVFQGDQATWQDFMLSFSHLGMAAEALLFVRFFRIRIGSLIAVGVWTLFNDYADYGFAIYPWLPDVLEDDLGVIRVFTVWLSFISLGLVYQVYRSSRNSGV